MNDEERIQELINSKTIEVLTKRMFVKEVLAQLKTTAPIENESAAIRSILVSANKKLAGSDESSSAPKETIDDLRSQVLLNHDENNAVVIDEGFSAKFGEVIWAKSGQVWWPSYIIDPRMISTLSSVDKVREKAFNSINTKYCVYFYGSGDYGFVLPTDKQIRNYIDHRSEYELNPSSRYQSDFELALSLADNEAIVEPTFRTVYVTTQIVSLLPSSPEEGTGVAVKRRPGRPKKMAAAKVVEESKDGEGETTTVVKSRGGTKKQKDTETMKKEPKIATSDNLPMTEVIKKKPGRPPKAEKSIPENVIAAGTHSSSSSSAKRTSSSISQASTDFTDQVDQPRQKIKKTEHLNNSSSDDDFVAISDNLSTEIKMEGVKKLISALERCCDNAQGQAPDVKKAIKIIQNLSQLPLNIEELRESKAAETISSLRKHENPKIAEEAKKLRHKWIDEHRNKEEKMKVPMEQLQEKMPPPNPSQAQMQQQEERSEVDAIPLAVTVGEPIVMGTQPVVSEEGNLCRSRVLRMLTELLMSGHDHTNSSLTQETIHRAAVRLEAMAFRVLCVPMPSSTSTATSSSSVVAGVGHSMVDSTIATTMNRYLASISRLAFGLQLSGAARSRNFLLYATDGAFLTSTALLDLLNAKTADEFAKLISSPF